MREVLGAALLVAWLLGAASARASLPGEPEEPPPNSYHEIRGESESEVVEGLRVSVVGSALGPHWGYVPLDVRLQNLEGTPRRVQITLSESDGSATLVTRTVEVAPRQSLVVWLPVPSSARGGVVRLHSPEPFSRAFSVYTVNRADAVLVVGTREVFEKGTGLVSVERGNLPVRFLAAESAPRELASYAGYSQVVVAGPPADLHADVWSTLEAYAATGGQLVLLQSPRDLAQRLPLLAGDAPAESVLQPYVLGWVRRCSEGLACGGELLSVAEASKTSTEEVGPLHPKLVSRGSRRYSHWNSEHLAEPLLPGVHAPVGRFLLLITLFVLVVGPGGLMLARRKGPVAVLIAVPGVSLLTCLAIVLWSLVVEGLSLSAARYSVTWLDRPRDRALTAGVGGYYANLTPAPFSLPASSVLLTVDDGSRTHLESDWTQGQRVLGGFLPARAYREWGELGVRPSRARLTFRSGPEGTRVLNALGAPIVAGYVRDGDVVWSLPELAEGAEGTASRVAVGDTLKGPLSTLGFSERVSKRFSTHVRDMLLAPLGPGEFVVKTGGPGADMATATLDMKLHEGLHLVRGQVDGP
ncbi:hypothetical protein [Archangium primigenium]|uniref:hypothetical protein n=1 Tax=[Archangium] primigenium TaxID=2792470 RepID=UPI00195AF2D6|nr:hypothetical protein [Archangium primigenium]MBM7113462.1 hypothetical protein [Archangium primigenium]